MRPLRIAVVTLIGAFELAAVVTTLVTFDRPVAEYGYRVGTDGETVRSVEPGLPAANAGIEPGDTIRYASLPVAGRLYELSGDFVAPATALRLDVVHRGRARSTTILPVELPRLYALANLAFAIAGLALGTVSLALVLLRPSRMTWGFALVVPPEVLPDALVRFAHQAPVPIGFSYDTFVSLLYALQMAGVMMFASRFPNDVPCGSNRFIDRLAIPFGIAAAGVYAYVTANVWFATTPPVWWALFAQDYVAPGLPSLLALFAISTTCALSSGNVRSRLAPTLAAYVLLIVSSVAINYGGVLTSSPGQTIFLYFFNALALVLVAAAVAYGVVRHRVIDVNFFIGRTLVYTMITIFAVSVFTLIEFLFGKLLERGGLALILEIGAALVLGVSLNALHNRLDTFVDRVLFRRRHLAEERLAQAAGALPHATSKALVADMLTAEPGDALELASAAVFVLSDDERRYTRVRGEGWSDAHAAELDPDDHLVVRLRAELRAVHLEDMRWPRSDVPSGTAQPIYAIPIAVGNRLEALALYGGHSGGQALDPDERKILRSLASAAALAYDHLRAVALRESLDEARGENASLRRIERTLTSLLGDRLDRRGEAN